MSRRILRYTFGERVVHWIAGFSYVYLLITGLAFFFPLLYWLTVLVGGGPTARSWHPWAGVIFTIAVVWMYRMWRRDMRMTDVDRRWNKALKHYIRNEDDRVPPAGRFNAGQKTFFWLMFYGGLALLLSGLFLWFADSLRWMWLALRLTALLVHVVAALLTIGGFIVHVYMGTAVVRGGFTSIIRGEVTEEWARTHHPLWLSEQQTRK